MREAEPKQRKSPFALLRFSKEGRNPADLVRITILDPDEDVPDRFELACRGEGGKAERIVLSERRMKVRLLEMGIPETVVLLVRERLANHDKVYLNKKTLEHIT